MMLVFHLIHAQGDCATPIPRVPDSELVSERSLHQQPGWADVDQDSVPDLFRSSSGVLLVYPSSLGQDQPIELPVEGCVQLFAVREAGLPSADGPTSGEGPPGTVPVAVQPVVAVLSTRSDSAGSISSWLSEYEVGLSPGTARLLWSEPAGELSANPLSYVGDVDGDGVSDLRLSGPYVPDTCDAARDACIQYELRLSEDGGRQPLPESVDGRNLWYVHGVGDLDSDGYGDLALGFREIAMDPWGKYQVYVGHLAAYPGSASGLQDEEPLWRIEGAEVPFLHLAPGASALRIEGTDVLVITLMNESLGPVRQAELALVRDASTGAAYLDQRVVLRPTDFPPSWPDYARSYDYWPKPWLQAEQDGATSIAVVVENGVEWFSIDPVDQGLSSGPVSSWVRERPLNPDWIGFHSMAWTIRIDPYVSGPAQPLVAWTQTEPILTGVGLAVWGWSPPGGGSTIVDIDPAYVNLADCSLAAEPVDPPSGTGTETGWDTGGLTDGPDRKKDRGDKEGLLGLHCGCSQGGGIAAAPAVAFALGLVLRRRRGQASKGSWSLPPPLSRASGSNPPPSAPRGPARLPPAPAPRRGSAR
jgi:hypothetical protein